MIGSAGIFQNRVLVVLQVGRGEVSTVKIQVVFLLAVIRQRLARNLPSRDAATVSEHREEERIHAGALLQYIEDFFGTFIHERDCSYLDTNHFGGSSGVSCGWHGQGGTRSSGDFQEFATI